MPRGKRVEKPKEVLMVSDENTSPYRFIGNFQEETDEQLVQRHIQLDDWVKAEKKRFESFLEPHKQELDVIANEFLRRFNERKSDNSKTEYGTAYVSRLMSVSVSPEGAPYEHPDANGSTVSAIGREALLDFALDHWDEIGNELLLISAQKDAVRKWMEEHEGVPPPGLKIEHIRKVNIRRS